jgi:hypothetical protein
VVTVSAVNDPPTLTGMADQTITVNGTTGPLNFTIGDVDTAVGSLTVNPNSSNLGLVPLGNIVLVGSGTNRTITVTPAAGQTGTATITVSVSDENLSASNSFGLTVNVAAPVAVARVNAGGGTFTDSAGNTWSADTGYNTGSTYSGSAAISGTTADALYQSERYDVAGGSELQYNFTVPNGNYQARLHFAEIYSGNFAVARRVFDVLMEGNLVVDNLDIYAQVGANAALVVSVLVTVSDGQLNIQFVHGVENPKISAIEVLSLPAQRTLSVIADQTTAVNTTAIMIPDSGVGTPYPSVINVSGMGGTISNLTVTLSNLTHVNASDVDVLLVGPTGQKLVLMSDAGSGNADNVTLTLSDAAAAALPASGLVSGTFRPTNLSDPSPGGDNLPASAPPGPYAAALSIFNGTGANGAWSLYVFDDGPGGLGSIAGGWSLTISTTGAAVESSNSVAVAPEITSVTLDGLGGIRLNVRGQVGLSYALEASSDLVNWTKVDVQDNTTGSIEFVDQPATNAMRFYRAVSTPK